MHGAALEDSSRARTRKALSPRTSCGGKVVTGPTEAAAVAFLVLVEGGFVPAPHLTKLLVPLAGAFGQRGLGCLMPRLCRAGKNVSQVFSYSSRNLGRCGFRSVPLQAGRRAAEDDDSVRGRDW
jgi:hypothetical protein